MRGVTELAAGCNAFGFDLYRRLPAGQVNQVLSPASVTISLAMVWGGARGETAAQMEQVLHFADSPGTVMAAVGHLTTSLIEERDNVLRIANGLFGDKALPFERAFLLATRAASGVIFDALDFKHAAESARSRINDWVHERTERRIQELIPPGGVGTDTGLVVANGIYFLGGWMDPFEREETYPAPFHASKTDEKDVPTMHRTGVLRVAEGAGLQMLELPYRGGSLSMLLILPDTIDGLAATEESLTATKFAAVVASLSDALVSVALPKFAVKSPESLSLGDTLTAMGMGTAFDPLRADFTGIADPPDPRDRLCLGAVFHKAFVSVDEEGTEAAAATTGMAAVFSALPKRRAEFRADHPFLFFIRDNASGLVVFQGRVADP